MLKEDFQKIENGINIFLCGFLKNSLSNNYIDFDALDTSSLIEHYINNFDEIMEKNNYENKELLNRAWLLKMSRNRYYHIKGNSKIDNLFQLSDMLNIYLFVKSMEQKFNNETDYLEFMSYLEYKVFYIFNASKDVHLKNKQKADNDYKEFQKILLDIYNTVVKTIPDDNKTISQTIPEDSDKNRKIVESLKTIKPKVVMIKRKLENIKPKAELIKQNITEIENNQILENKYIERRKVIVVKKKIKK